MSDTDHSDPPADDARIVAAEYVLGVLDGAQRRVLAQRLETEPALAREVAFWDERLGGLADTVRSVPPPAATWSRIETAIAAPPAASAPARAGLWQSLVFWRSFAIGSAAVAAACAAALIYSGTRLPRETGPLLATLGQTSGQPGFVAAIGSDGRSLTIVPASLLTADQRSMQLWLIPAGDRPHSLGLIAAGQPVRLTVPAELVPRVNTDATLAVSIEPLGGSPTGQPTGPVVAAGKLTNL